VNSPIQITEDTVIKAITIGPGKEDSEVITFTFTVDHTGETPDPTKVYGGPPTGVILDRYSIDIDPGGTFMLSATVAPFNAEDQRVIWSSSDTSVATVDTRGLVTVVGPGSAVITVTTADGNHTATCVVNGPKEEEESVAVGAVGTPENAVKEESQKEEPPVEDEKKKPEETTVSPEPSEQELEEPEAKGQYLAEKNDLAEVLIAEDLSGVQPDTESSQVFEMSIETGVPWPIEDKPNMANIYCTAICIFLFLTGAGKRYVEYAKELTVK
jgi:hypothetical protein